MAALPSFSACGGLPTSPCLADGLSCYDPSNACFGFVVAQNDPSTWQLIPSALCTLDICPLIYNQGHFSYDPLLWPNAFVAALFAIVLLSQIGLAIKWKTWGFLAGMIGGLVLEVLGYIGRVQMSKNPFAKNSFLLYLICATIGPAFLSASIYLCLARIVVAYGDNLSRFKPRTYTLTFVSCDLFSLVLQAIGGAMASTANTQDVLDRGVNVMIAGLAFQVVSLALFMALCADFGVHVIKAKGARNRDFANVYERPRFKIFFFALGVATLAIFVRSVYRVAELKQGFHGPLANQESTYMVLEGGMVLIAVILVTIWHPGLAFAGRWADANFRFKTSTQSGKLMQDDSNIELARGNYQQTRGAPGYE